MAIHHEVLAAARRICTARGAWTFSPAEIVSALAHRNESSVRTHVVSRCCVNAPSHHARRLPYFERVRRGVYRIRPEFREVELPMVADGGAAYAVAYVAPHESIHVAIAESEGQYVAECLEVAVVTQGRTLDETLVNLREAVDLYLTDEDPEQVGVIRYPRLSITLDMPTGGG